jgi:hypothetical protein
LNDQPELWIGLVHLRPLKREALEGAAGAYTNIITWARDSAGFREKAEVIGATMNLCVVDVEGEEPLRQRFEGSTPTEELEDMIERAENNPHAIVYGTFHQYLRDES